MKVHFAGTYGYGSFGDDCYVDTLRFQLNGVWNPLELIQDRVDEEPFSPTSQDAGILAGSGLLYSHLYESGADSLEYYLRFLAAMQLFGKNTFALALGVQGELTPSAIAPYVSTFDSMDLRTVRDSESAARLRAAGLTSPVLECADISYLTPRAPKAVESRSSSAKPVLGVVASQSDHAVIYPGSDGFERRILDALELLDPTFDLRFLSFNRATDDWLPQAWNHPAEHYGYDDKDPDGIRNFTEAVRDVDVLLTSRLHGIILAASAGIPFVAVGASREKVDRECRALDHPFFKTFDVGATDLAQILQDVWNDRFEIRTQLGGAFGRRRQLAQRTFDLLTTIANEPEHDRMPRELDTDSTGKKLLVWAASSSFLAEVETLLDRWAPFDVLASVNASIEHKGILGQFVVPQPGILNWAAFSDELKNQLQDTYDCVVVCHSVSEARPHPRLVEIARQTLSYRDQKAWELRLWTHQLSTIQTEPETTSSRTLTAPLA